jgi:hypothetical protein
MTSDDELVERLRRTLEHEAAAITPTRQHRLVFGQPGLQPQANRVDPAGPYPNYSSPEPPRHPWTRWPLIVTAAAVVGAAVTLAALNWPGGGSSRVGVLSPSTSPRPTVPVRPAPVVVPTPTTVPAPVSQTTPTTAAPPSTTVAPAAVPTTPPTAVPVPVPADFAPQAVTFVSASQGWVAGTVPCPSGRCLAVARTADGGVVWEMANAPAVTVKTPDFVATVSVRFADPDNGWIYTTDPGGLWSTHDGGATWTSLSATVLAPGAVVDALEASGGQVQAAIVDGAMLHMESSPVGTDSWTATSPALPVGAGGTGASTQIVLQQSSGWVVQDDRTVVGGLRLTSSGEWAAWTPPCTNANGDVVLAASNPTDLIAVCDEAEWGPATNLPAGADTSTPSRWLFRSSNGGTSFQAVSALPSGLGSGVLASTSPSNIIIGGGPAPNSPPGDLSASFNGGKNWQTVYTAAPVAYAGGQGPPWTYLGFTTTTQGVAIGFTESGSPELLMTQDGGHTWSPVLL